MRTVTLSPAFPNLKELLELATQEAVILKTPEGQEFMLAEVAHFDEEVQSVCQHQELMRFLDKRSRETETYTLSQVREELNL